MIRRENVVNSYGLYKLGRKICIIIIIYLINHHEVKNNIYGKKRYHIKYDKIPARRFYK